MFLTPFEISAIKLSIIVAGFSVLICIPFGILFGFLLARKNFWGKSFLEMLINFSLILPPVVVGYALLLLLGRKGLLGSYLWEHYNISIAFTIYAAIIAAAVISFPLMVRSIQTSFLGVDQRLEAAARSLGASRVRSFFTISLPLARNGVIAGTILAFVRGLGEFGAAVVFAGNIEGETQTLSLAIFSLSERPGGIEASWRLVVFSILIAAIALYFSQKLEKKHERA